MGLPIKLKNPAPATPGCRAASGSGSVHPISYSPRRSRSRLCCSIAMLRASHGHHRRAARDGLDQAGDLLALDLARLRTLSPDLKAIGLSATVARPSELAAFLDGHEGKARAKLAEIVDAGAGPKAETRSFTEPDTPHAMRRIEFFTPRDTGGLNVLDKRLLLVVPLAFDGSMADGPHRRLPAASKPSSPGLTSILAGSRSMQAGQHSSPSAQRADHRSADGDRRAYRPRARSQLYAPAGCSGSDSTACRGETGTLV